MVIFLTLIIIGLLILLIVTEVKMNEAIQKLKEAIEELNTTITNLPENPGDAENTAAINDAADAIATASQTLKEKFPA